MTPCCTIDGPVSPPPPARPPGPPAYEAGWWLLARLAVHWHLRRTLARRLQEPLDGLELRRGDRLEVARITLDMAVAASGGPRGEVR